MEAPSIAFHQFLEWRYQETEALGKLVLAMFEIILAGTHSLAGVPASVNTIIREREKAAHLGLFPARQKLLAQPN